MLTRNFTMMKILQNCHVVSNHLNELMNSDPEVQVQMGQDNLDKMNQFMSNSGGNMMTNGGSITGSQGTMMNGSGTANQGNDMMDPGSAMASQSNY